MSHLAKLQAHNESIRLRDTELAAELDKLRSVSTQAQAPGVLRQESAEGDAPQQHDLLVAETIVLRTGRPVLAVKSSLPELVFTEIESEVWRGRLEPQQAILAPKIASVGRIEVANNPRFDWVGTGWLVDSDIVVTNRHVAQEFARGTQNRFVFRMGPSGAQMASSVDFLQEVDSNLKKICDVVAILWIEDEDGPDLAFLKLKGSSFDGARVGLSGLANTVGRYVGAIGYPAKDSRLPDQDLVQRVFGDVYNKKRFAPGQITGIGQGQILHDCSTLGGNSGSLILDIESGEALGIHFAGSYLEANYAVPSSTIAEHLHSITSGKPVRTPVRVNPEPVARPQGITPHAPVPVPQAAAAAGTLSFTIPLQITIQVSAPVFAPGAPASPPVPSPVPPPVSPSAADIGFALPESTSVDYSDREGFSTTFLGERSSVALPVITRDVEEVVTYQLNGEDESELRYEHFSVVMNRKRRMCFFSAVNIDGNTSQSSTRAGWRYDGRIPSELQIMNECYGNPPRFSRGHMTRREDPVWGTPDSQAKGNTDSMHVTNVTPQMQSFNAPIWLGLENYALQNARKDKMKICVITGPILRESDPEKYGVKVPLSFFKIIVFLHDETGKLTATGYSTSQEAQIQEFVFSEYKTWQRPISWIEEQAGLSFGALRQVDPLAHVAEGIDTELTGLDQIRFH